MNEPEYKMTPEVKALIKALQEIRGDGPLLAEADTIDDGEELIEMYVIAQRVAEEALRAFNKTVKA